MAYFKYQGKSVYYTEYGQGEPLVFLHGNTASSKMSGLLMPLYADKFRCILEQAAVHGRQSMRHWNAPTYFMQSWQTALTGAL